MAKLISASTVMEDPPIARFLFSDVRFAWVWVLVRVYLGYQWFEAGLHKYADPGWMSTGTSLQGFWKGAVAVPPAPAHAAITYDWYRDFLNFLLANNAHTWFAKVVVYGEILIGV